MRAQRVAVSTSEKLRSLPPRSSPTSSDDSRERIERIVSGVNVLPWRLERTLVQFSTHDRPVPRKKVRADVGRLFLHGDVPDLSVFPNLQELFYRPLRNPIEPLFEAAARLSKLDVLGLNMASLRSVPERILELRELRWLELEGNDLDELPQVVCKLDRLEALDIRGNPLTTIPREIERLQSLRALVLGRPSLESSGPGLTSVPDTFTKLGKLHCIQLYPLSMPLEELQLHRFPELRYVGIHGQAVPAFVGELRQLHGLAIDTSDYQALPDGLGNLLELRYLRVTHTPLAEVPRWLSDMRKLRGLHLYSGIEIDMMKLVDAITPLDELEELFLDGAQQPLVKRALAKLGFTPVRGAWHIYRRPGASERLIEPFPRQ